MNLKFFLPVLSFLFSLQACGQPLASSPMNTATVVSPPIDTLPKKQRNFTRFEKEIVRFEENDKALMPKSNGILFVGSSSIRLWKNVAQDMAPMPVINRGFGGATIGEVNYYFKRIVAKYHPRFLVFYAGENDLFHPEVSVDSVVNDFNRFRDSMRVYEPQCRMYFVSVKPSPARWHFQEKFTEANKRFQAICASDPNWMYVDIVPQMLTADGRPRKDIFRSDSLHMNSFGYADWTGIIKPKLTTAWKSALEMEKKPR